MISDIEYIDKLTKDNLVNLEQFPETSWNEFYTNFSGEMNPSSSSISNSSGYITMKNIVLTVVSLSILTTGVLMYANNENDKLNLPVCKAAITKKVIVSDELVYEVKLSSNFEKEDSAQIKKGVNSNKSKDVVIRVEVPIYKKIEVRKEIIINDSLQD